MAAKDDGRTTFWKKGVVVVVEDALYKGRPKLQLLPKLILLVGSWSDFAGFCVVVCRIGCPESQVVTQKLHDQRRVLVAILIKGVQLGNGLIEGLK